MDLLQFAKLIKEKNGKLLPTANSRLLRAVEIFNVVKINHKPTSLRNNRFLSASSIFLICMQEKCGKLNFELNVKRGCRRSVDEEYYKSCRYSDSNLL